jgi:hypothetical protein
VLFVVTGQKFGDTTSPPNVKPIVLCRMEHAQALWRRPDTADWREGSSTSYSCIIRKQYQWVHTFVCSTKSVPMGH